MQRRLLVVLMSVLGLGGPAGPAAVFAEPAAAAPLVVVAESAAGVVQLDPGTGAVLRVLVPGGRTPAVSPDGRRLVFGLPDGTTAQHLFVSNIDGSDRVQLTSGAAFDLAPDWSPDGQRVAMCRATGQWPVRTVRLAVVGSTGSGGRAVDGTDGGCTPSWSPDSALLAYTAPDGVRVTDVDGRANDLVCVCGSSPDWSPDGRTIAVAGGGNSEGNITLLDVATKRTHVITEFQGYHVIWQEPVWAPDGTSLYTSAYTESFPDERGNTKVGTAIEHRDRDGTRDNRFWREGALSPAVGGGPAPLRDSTAPAPVTAAATPVDSGIDVTAGTQSEPDAAGVLVRYAPGDVAPATPHDGLPGGRSVTGHVALRQLAAETTYAISVFPLDWSGNVGERTVTVARTPHEVGTTMHLATVPQFVTYGQNALVQGRLTREDTGGPIAGAAVQLLGHLRGQPDRLLATLTTDADGVVASSRLPTGETTYTLQYAGSDPFRAATAQAVVRVRVALVTALSTSSVRRGGRARVTVRLRPGLKQNKVYVEQRINDKLRYRATALTDSTGAVTFALDTRIRGSYRVTASSNGDGLRTYGISPARTLTVR